MDSPRLTPGAVKEIWDLPDGPGTIKPVLQVSDLRPVTTKSSAAAAKPHSERFRLLLSDGVHSQQSMLSTDHNHLVRDGTLRVGSIVHLHEITCNTIQERRIIIVVKLDVLQSECAMIGKPKIYEKKVPEGQVPNLPANSAQVNSGIYSGGPGMLGNAGSQRVEQVANNPSYGGPYSGVHGPVGSSIGRTIEPGPNNVLSGGSYGTMSAQNTMNANAVQPSSQRPLLNSHQNQRFAVPGTGVSSGHPGNTYGRPAQPSYQQPPPAYRNSGPAAKNEAAPRVIPISALNPYQGTWTIKARVTAKGHVKHFKTMAKGPGKLFNFDLHDANGGEIRAVCFDSNTRFDQFYVQIEVDKVYLISRGALKPTKRQYNHLNNDYEIHLDATTSIEVCSGDDSSIPMQQFNFRPISEIANMDKGSMVDLIGVVTSVGPSSAFMRKNGVETQKRVLQLKDMSGCSVEITFWGDFCNAEGQRLQSLCDSGVNPVLSLRSGCVNEFNGRTVSTISSSSVKVNPDGSEAERLRQWYITEGENTACTSLSVGMSSMGRTDVRNTVAQISQLGKSEKPDWITVMGAISHISTDNFCYPACTALVNGTSCNKKVTNTGDGMWQGEKCEHSSPNCEYRYMLPCQIQDHTGITTFATAFQEAGNDIIGLTAEELLKIQHEDVEKFAGIIKQARFRLYIFKLKVKEETYNDETRVKATIVKAQKLDDTSKESRFLLGVVHGLLTEDGSGSTPGVNGAASINAGFTSNNTYGTNMGGTSQFGQQAGLPGRMPSAPSAIRYPQPCSVCGSYEHSLQNCPAAAMDIQQQPAGFPASSYGSSAGNANTNTRSDLCFKCHQPGHYSSACPGLLQATSYGGTAAGNANARSDLCYKCHQPGHYSRDCPGQQQAASSYAPSAGNANARSDLCYKCSQPGHFSRDCPLQQGAASSYGPSAGNSNARSDLCYKCSQPGHFSRDCPGQQAGAPQRQAYGNGVVSGGYNRQSYG